MGVPETKICPRCGERNKTRYEDKKDEYCVGQKGRANCSTADVIERVLNAKGWSE